MRLSRYPDEISGIATGEALAALAAATEPRTADEKYRRVDCNQTGKRPDRECNCRPLGDVVWRVSVVREGIRLPIGKPAPRTGRTCVRVAGARDAPGETHGEAPLAGFHDGDRSPPDFKRMIQPRRFRRVHKLKDVIQLAIAAFRIRRRRQPLGAHSIAVGPQHDGGHRQQGEGDREDAAQRVGESSGAHTYQVYPAAADESLVRPFHSPLATRYSTGIRNCHGGSSPH